MSLKQSKSRNLSLMPTTLPDLRQPAREREFPGRLSSLLPGRSRLSPSYGGNSAGTFPAIPGRSRSRPCCKATGQKGTEMPPCRSSQRNAFFSLPPWLAVKLKMRGSISQRRECRAALIRPVLASISPAAELETIRSRAGNYYRLKRERRGPSPRSRAVGGYGDRRRSPASSSPRAHGGPARAAARCHPAVAGPRQCLWARKAAASASRVGERPSALAARVMLGCLGAGAAPRRGRWPVPSLAALASNLGAASHDKQSGAYRPRRLRRFKRRRRRRRLFGGRRWR
jgi:hypothetical protein